MFKQGKTVKSSFFFIRWLPNRLAIFRLAVMVPGKVSRQAVARNRCKRLITEWLKELATSYSGFDLVLVVSPTILGKSQNEIKNELEKNIKLIFVNQ